MRRKIGKLVQMIKGRKKRIEIRKGHKYYYLYYYLKRGGKFVLINVDRVSSLPEARRYARAWLRVR